VLKDYRIVKYREVDGLQMLVPDFWKGRGRFSKQATCRKVKDETPYTPKEKSVSDGEER